MVKMLTRHGNSYALVIDKPILDLLRITPETPLEVTTDGSGLWVRPAPDPEHHRKFLRALRLVNKRYGVALRKLAE